MRGTAVALVVLGLFVATTAHGSNPVRISQVYGGGVLGGASLRPPGHYKCDYVELFNNSDAPVAIGGWSVQHGSAGGSTFGSSTWSCALIPSGAVIPACGYYLIQGYCSTIGGAELPVTADLVTTTVSPPGSLRATSVAGKFVLFNDQVTGRDCATAKSVAVDMVGYGMSANCSETAAAPAGDDNSVLVRAGGGAGDTDDNSADFSKVAHPRPMHNSASPPNPYCRQHPPDPPTMVAPAAGASGVAVPAPLTVAVSDADADSLTVQFYGRPAPSGACCRPGDECVFVTAAECAARSGTYQGDGLLCGPRVCDIPEQFTLVLLPDTQFYTEQSNGGTNDMFKAQTRWIVDNRVSRRIAAVAHLGDVTDTDVAPEWMRADTAMKTLEDPATTGLADGIPYVMNFGNHDDNGGGTLFSQYFGVSRFSGRGYYGGHYGSDNDNSYILFNAAGRDFIVLSLRYRPTSERLTWADSVLAANPNRLGIVVSHSMIRAAGEWMVGGQAIYDALKDRPNLILLACGHYAEPESRRTDVFEGRPVTTLLSDYQSYPNGGNGYLRIMEFVPAVNQVRVRTYSPWLGQWETDADSSSQFTLNNVPLGGTPPSQAAVVDFALLGTVAGVPSGSKAVFRWSGLATRTQYEWYAVVSDGQTSRTGPVRSLTTGTMTAGVEDAARGGPALAPPAPDPAPPRDGAD